MFRIAAVLTGAMLLSGEASAQCSSTWTNLQNNTTADATQVMGNFNYLNCTLGTLAPLAGPKFTGNVGIGTTSPAAELDVEAPSYSSLRLGGALGDELEISSSSAATDQKLWDVFAGGTGTVLQFRAVNDAYSAANSWMQVNRGSGYMIASVDFPSSSVGIGTTNPIATLTVQSGNGDVILNGTAATTMNTAGSLRFFDNGTFLWHLFGWHPDGNFYLQNNGGSTNMRVVAGTNSWAATSDVRLKTNIKTLPVLDRLRDYRAVSFDWKQTGRHDIGVVAQELYKVFPEVVNKGSDGALSGPADMKSWSVQYDKLGALALEAAKELKAENDKLRASNDALHAADDKLRAANQAQAQQLQALEARMARIETLVKPRITAAAARQ